MSTIGVNERLCNFDSNFDVLSLAMEVDCVVFVEGLFDVLFAFAVVSTCKHYVLD